MQVCRDQERLSGQLSTKALALLALLAADAGRLQRRDTLATLLWPDQPRNNARHSLRQALSTLRRVLGDSPSPLVTEGDLVGFHPNGPIRLDVAEFQDLIAQSERHAHRRPESCVPCARRYEQAVEMYRGDFCAGLVVDDSSEFEEWLHAQRERLRQRALVALGALAAHHERAGRYPEARRLVERQLELDPWREAAHRNLMRLLVLMNERTAALQQFERCRRVLEEELGLEPEDETIDLYERIKAGAGLDDGPSPKREPATAATVIAGPATPLIGRERDLQRIADLLTLADCRLLSLIGPGGIGKTRLALQVARDLHDAFTHSAHVVSLAPVRSTELVIPTIVEALGLAQYGRADPLRHLTSQLRDREMLLVLDNMEHLLDSAPLIAALLANAPDLTILATSRERLGVQAEWVYAVEGLDVPPESLPRPEESPSVQLFISGLRRVRPSTPLREEELTAIGTICRLVEGMPLAIELAATWAATLPIGEIVAEMEQGIDFLAVPLRDVPARHRSMRAVFDQSWELLTPDEQRVFQRLAIFHGGFTREAAEQVAGATLPVLSALVAKSFLRADGSGRYGIHELLRQYGEARLAMQHREEVRTRDRYARHVLGFVADQEAALTGAQQRQALAALTTEIANVRHAWRCALQLHLREPLDRATHALWLFYVLRGWMREGEQMFGALAEALQDLEEPSEDDRILLARAMTRQGGFQSGLGQFASGIEHIQNGLDVLRTHDVCRESALALNFLAAATHLSDVPLDEQELLEESLRLFRKAGDPWGEAYALNDLALLAHARGHIARAQQLCRQSQAIFERVNDVRGLAFTAHHLGTFALAEGDVSAARQHHRRALELRRASEDQWGIAASHVQLGLVEHRAGNIDEAESLLTAALREARTAWVLPVVLEALVELAALLMDRGEHASATGVLLALLREPGIGRHLRQRAEAMLAASERQLAETERAGIHERASGQTVESLAAAFAGR